MKDDPKTAAEAMESGDFEAAVALMEQETAPAPADEEMPAVDTSAGSDTPAADADAGTPDKAAAEAASQAAAETKIDGVLLKDGKNVLPYEVFAATRRRAEESERRLAELQGEIQTRTAKQAELESQMAELRRKAESAAAQAGSSVDAAAQAADPENPLAGIDENELPEGLVKAIKGIYGQLTTTRQKLEATTAELGTIKQAKATTQTDAEASATQAEIDANPSLAAWQGEGGDAWKKAIEIDNRLREDPKWQDKPLSDRFAKVVRIVCAELDIEPVATADKSAGAKAETAAVASISDLPGGSPSHQTGIDALESASGRQTLAMFSGMSDDAIERALRGLE